MTTIVNRWGGLGAVENVRVEIETRRFALQQVDALTRRVARVAPTEPSKRKSA